MNVEEIQRIAGIHPNREVCPFKCGDAVNRRPCHCYPGYSTAAAVRLYGVFEKHFKEAK
jgi:hypothetical protein